LRARFRALFRTLRAASGRPLRVGALTPGRAPFTVVLAAFLARLMKTTGTRPINVVATTMRAVVPLPAATWVGALAPGRAPFTVVLAAFLAGFMKTTGTRPINVVATTMGAVVPLPAATWLVPLALLVPTRLAKLLVAPAPAGPSPFAAPLPMLPAAR
jgi:hypothetical protein